VDVSAVAGGWAPGWQAGVLPRNDQEIVIPVSFGGAIEVRLVGAEGQPMSGVQVMARPLGLFPGSFSLMGRSGAPRPTDPLGVALLDLLAPGTYEVSTVGGEAVSRVQVAVEEGGRSSVVLTLR
jgi:hypothetical protein